ncbi:MAG: HDOD domain-containing protein [Deltaproteobacteria bacterium]|nr:HDOD domain-containing protein [Deltaproteobacteria bacterium]
MKVYVARQPIFKRNRKIYGYELLFRGGLTNVFPDIDGDTATSKLLSNTFFTMGMERVSAGKKAFINFTQDLLVKKYPLMFPRESVTVEVLENVVPEPEVVDACSEIAEKGYEIALDDFIYEEALEPLIKLSRIIKIDFMITPMDQIAEYVEKLSPYHVKFLAEKVETHEVFQQAFEMGFSYFQGYFFSKPQVLQSRDVAPSKINLLQLMVETNKEDMEFEDLEKIITRDVSISYKLLRYMNSAYFRRLREISSIKQAIVLLGQQGIRSFISLIIMAKLASEKPVELLRTSIIRARMCELLGKGSRSPVDTSELFTLGLFSLIDAILDQEMEKLMEKLPLSEPIKRALVNHDGHLSHFLDLVKSYETGDWKGLSESVAKVGIGEDKVPEYYLDAIGWADSVAGL